MSHQKSTLQTEYRQEFSIFKDYQQKKGIKLAFLDSAASAQKPDCLINAIKEIYSSSYANIHRGAYYLSAEATKKFEDSRKKVASFINAKSANEIVFTRNATEGINLIAECYCRLLKPNDVILTTELEHHSNIVPWQLAAEKYQLKLEYLKITEDGLFDLEDWAEKIKLQPKLVSLTMHSNALGTLPQYEVIAREAREKGAVVLLDACQFIVHRQVDVQNLPVDFLVFSAHKLYGPTGVGVLYAKSELLDQMPPYQGGGDMIVEVTTAGSKWASGSSKFEAGTPAIAEVTAFATALEFIEKIGYSEIQKSDQHLTEQAWEMLRSIPSISIYGTKNSNTQSSIISFNLEGVHAHDIATIADEFGVQLRAGFHCAMPALHALKVYSTARISFGVYSQESDLLQFKEALLKAKKVFGIK